MIGMKSIRFPPPVADEMVRATLEGRKTVTRRVVKAQESDWKFLSLENDPYMTRINRNGEEYPSQETGLWAVFEWGAEFPLVKAPYRPGDILYVRETWTRLWCVDPDGYTHYDQPMYYYAADGTPDITLCDEDGFEQDDQRIRWHPSIHMPREAARIFLRVTDVRVERLQDITEEQAVKEGVEREYIDADISVSLSAKNVFADIWDSTIKPADRALCGREANPWVWVIKFERISREEALENG